MLVQPCWYSQRNKKLNTSSFFNSEPRNYVSLQLTSLFQYFTVFFISLFVASIYPALITFVHHKHLLNKDIDLSAKFENYPGLIGKT